MPAEPLSHRRIEIRKLADAERPDVAARMRDLAQRHGHDAASAAAISRVAARLADPLPEQEFLVALEGAKPIGVACFAMPQPAGAARPQLLVREICVPECGEGGPKDAAEIGRALLRALVRLAIARGCAGVDLGITAGIERGS